MAIPNTTPNARIITEERFIGASSRWSVARNRSPPLLFEKRCCADQDNCRCSVTMLWRRRDKASAVKFAGRQAGVRRDFAHAASSTRFPSGSTTTLS